MKKVENGFIKNSCYLCLIGIITIGLITAVATGCGGGGGDEGGGEAPSEITSILSDEEQSYLSDEELNEINRLSVSELLTKGFDNLRDREVLKSEVYFKAAEYKVENSTSNDADTARFFYALTRVASLGFDIHSDGVDDGFKDIGDILDAFGCSETGRDPWGDEDMTCPDTLPSNSLTGKELQDFLYDVVRPDLEGAIANLDSVSQSFNKTWTEPFDNTTVESDYGDVLVFRAVVKGALATILIQHAYDLNVDIDTEANDTDNTIQEFLADNPDFITLTNSSYLNSAKGYLNAATDDLVNAIDWIDAETDDQSDDLIDLADITSDEIDEAKEAIADFKDCLSGECTTDDNDTAINTLDDTIINMALFFDGINLRELLPDYDGDDSVGYLPDPTFGGILVQLEGEDPTVLNEDLDNNGTADIFE